MKDLLAGLGIESLSPPIPRKSRTGTAPGYPPRQHVDEEDAPWTRPLANYHPPEYTADVVVQHEGRWADPQDVKDVKRAFLTRTGSGDVEVALDAWGRPLNPLGRTGLQGRGLLGRWGRNQAGDPLLTRVHPDTGRLQVLVIERKDSGQKALPGGMVDEGEEIATTVARELSEETGAKLSFEGATTVLTGIVDDPRNTDNAWMETTVLHKHLTAAEQDVMTLRAGDDARAVHWANVDRELLASMYASHGDYVRLALLGLQKHPAVARQVSELLER
jgi:ADP-ribose pyrophosphatase